MSNQIAVGGVDDSVEPSQGQRVTIASGPLEGAEGVVISSNDQWSIVSLAQLASGLSVRIRTGQLESCY